MQSRFRGSRKALPNHRCHCTTERNARRSKNMLISRIHALVGRRQQKLFSSHTPSILSILEQVKNGTLKPSDAESFIVRAVDPSPEDAIKAFANLDHTRSSRTGFPEAVFAAGKPPEQVAQILDDMARNLNEEISKGDVAAAQRAILATRVTEEQYDAISRLSLKHGKIQYHATARIISMAASGLDHVRASTNEDTKHQMKRVVVATAGTTDLPVAEETAVVLEAAGCEVERITDVGVAGLHRIIKALPRLQDPNVGCVVVCAGMDGALPSVVGGLARVPVIAVPTSIGYGVSLGGISAMLTMLNSCAPGVGVVNIDNGFGAAALAYKCVLPTRRE